MDTSHRTLFEQTLDDLCAVDVHALDDATLRDALVAAEHVRNATEAMQARVMVEMRDRAHRADVADAIEVDSTIAIPTGAREEFVVDEIAAHLRCTKVAASHRFAVALCAQQHTPLQSRWAAGHLDARKVQVVAELLVGTDPVRSETLAAAAAEYAHTHTAPQLRVWLARRVIAADPHAAEQRRQRATTHRRVCLTALPDGMAELSADLPALQARHVYDTLTAVAHAADGTDARTLDQRRSDALYDLVTGRAEPPAVTLNVSVSASTLEAGAGPAELGGSGPLTADAIGDLVGAARWRRLLSDPTTGILVDVSEARYRPSRELDRAVRARDVTCRFPGCRRPATTARSGVDLDHTEPWPVGSTSASNLACLCRHHHRLKHSPGWQLEAEADGTLHWTTPTGHRFTTIPWQYDDPPDELDEAA